MTTDRLPVFDIRPGMGIGPIELGMTRDEARSAAAALSLSAEDFRRGSGLPPDTDVRRLSVDAIVGLFTREDGPPDLFIGQQLFAYFDGGDRVTEVEVAPSGPQPVVGLGIDFRHPIVEVMEAMAAHGRVDRSHPEFPSTADYPELGLCLWGVAEDDEVAKTSFQSILVRAPDNDPRPGDIPEH